MKKVLLAILVVTILFSLFGCGANKNASEPMMAKEERAYSAQSADMEMVEEMAVEEAAPMNDEAKGEAFDGMDASAIDAQSNRKLIYYFDYQIETTNFDADYEFILNKLAAINGYAQNASIQGTKPDEYGEPGRYANLNLRVPIDKYSEFIASLEGVGNILSKSQTTDDVSAQYFDTESRIRITKTKMKKLEELLDRSTELEDIITLENELSNTMYELDRYEGQIRQLDNLIDYTTISVSLEEVNEISTISQEEAGLGTRIKKAFKNTFDGLVRFLEGLLIVIIAGFPVWIIIAVVTFIIVKIVKRRRKKKLMKLEKGEK